MEELERMAEETRIVQLQLPDPADADPHPRLLLEGRGIHAGERFAALLLALVASARLDFLLKYENRPADSQGKRIGGC